MLIFRIHQNLYIGKSYKFQLKWTKPIEWTKNIDTAKKFL